MGTVMSKVAHGRWWKTSLGDAIDVARFTTGRNRRTVVLYWYEKLFNWLKNTKQIPNSVRRISKNRPFQMDRVPVNSPTEDWVNNYEKKPHRCNDRVDDVLFGIIKLPPNVITPAKTLMRCLRSEVG